MKQYEKIITSIMLAVISFSQVSTPVAYAAELGKLHVKLPGIESQMTTKLAPPSKVPQPDKGSVLGASTSLLAIGTQSLHAQQGTAGSASQQIPPRMVAMTKKVFKPDEPVTVSVINPDNESFTTQVTDANGKQVAVPVSESNNGTTTTVQLASSNDIRPGKYTVKITDQNGNSTSQNFTWGVLAMNFDKSEYHPNETATISMAVLDDTGNMVCDATVALRITNVALGIDKTLSTKNEKIIINPQCQRHGFSLQPDYAAHYQFAGTGNYQFALTATTASGTHTISDTIQVTNQIPFDIQRVSATRIYPPNSYPMTFTIKAHQNFSGTVTETVPENFTITPATQSATQTPVTSYTDMQTLYLSSKRDPTQQMQQQIFSNGTTQLVMPFHGKYPITQGFGAQQTDPLLQALYSHYGLSGHDGIDFGVPMHTPIYAVDAGTVIWSGPGVYGVTIIIQHSWGKSYYGHLNNTSVTVGEAVAKGQLIGYSGESGEATGPHLHFGMRPNHPDMQNGYYGKIDPLPYLPLGHMAASTTTLGTSTNLITPLHTTTVLGASISATPAATSSAATPTPTLLPTKSPTQPASISATPALTVQTKPNVTPVITSTPALTPTVTPQATPPANGNFTVLDKEIKLNEQLANNAQVEKVKVLTWHVHLQKGESTVLGYTYQIPRKSPAFYLLGPVKFYANGSGKVVYQEKRQWELAGDDVGVEWYQNTGSGTTWNGYSWQYRKKITLNHAQTSSALYNSANWPTVEFMESGGDATNGPNTTGGTGLTITTGGFYTDSHAGTGSSISVDCQLAESGSCSIAAHSAGTKAYVDTPSLSSPNTGRVSGYFYFDTIPSGSNTMPFLNLNTSGNANVISLELEGDHLKFNSISPNTGTTAIQPNTWYRISMAYTVSSTTSYSMNVYVNGQEDLTMNSSIGTALSYSNGDHFRIGDLDAPDPSTTAYFDDIYIDNGTDMTDPGDIHVTAKLPIANGASNTFSTTGTPTGYTACTDGSTHCEYVNQRPMQAASYLYNTTAGLEEFTLQNAAQGDVDISKATLIANEAWVYALASSACTAYVINNGTSTSISLATTANMFTNITVNTTYPSGNQAIGMQSCSGSITKFYGGGVLIAYILPTSSTYTKITPKFMSSGTDATQQIVTSSGGSFDSTCGTGGTVSSDSTLSETGPRSLKFVTGSSGQSICVYKQNVLTDTGSRFTGYFNFSNLPTSTQTIISAENSAFTATQWNINITSGGVLTLTTYNGTQLGSNGPTLKTGQWYRIAVSYVIQSSYVHSIHSINVYVNGALAISDSSSTLVETGSNTLLLGWESASAGNNLVMHVDDIYIDNGSDMTDPGDIHVTAKLPIANGASNAFTASGTPVGYTSCSDASTHCEYVNERPINTSANLYSATANARENFTLQSASQGDVDISNAGMVADEAWIYAKSSTTCTGEITNNGVDASIGLTTTNNRFDSIGVNANFLSGDQGVGIQNCASGTVTLEEAGMLVAYTPNNPSYTLTDYPVLVNISGDTDLQNHAQSTCNDVVFTDSTGRNMLNFEFENASCSSGNLVAWVQIPILYTNQDTIIYMYYGNPSATSQANAPNVWDSDYKGVWHLGPTTPNGSTLSVNDSTSNGNNGTGNNVTETSGEIDGAASFNGITSSIKQSNVASEVNGLYATSGVGWTTEAWFNNSSPANYEAIIGRGGGTGTASTYALYLNSSGNLNTDLSGSTTGVDPGVNLSTGTWHFIVITWNGTNAYAYLDGGSAIPLSVGAASEQAATFCIGANNSCTSNFYYGSIDEVRVSDIARSFGWITTEYNNESSPSTFETMGSVETDIYAPTTPQLLRHGEWFDSTGTRQPFMF